MSMYENSENVDLLGDLVTVEKPVKTKRKRATSLLKIDSTGLRVIDQPALLPVDSTGSSVLTTYDVPSTETFLGNLIDIYDSVPRFVDNRVASNKGVVDNFQDSLRETKGVIKGISYSVIITAATIKGIGKKSSKSKELSTATNVIGAFPGVREEFVEKALRKLSTHQAEINGDSCTVHFTLYELSKELLSFGHHYSYEEIRSALLILSKANIHITTTNLAGRITEYSGTYISGVAIVSFDKNSKHYDSSFDTASRSDVRCRATLHPLIGQQIQRGEYRIYQYGLDMLLKQSLARSLLRHLSLHWANANTGIDHVISLNDFIKNVIGREVNSKIFDDHRYMKKAIESLASHGVLQQTHTCEPVPNTKGRGYSDYKYIIRPTNRFVTSVIQSKAGISKRQLSKNRR